MNANEIAFGIEFETTLPSTDNTPIGPYHSGYQVPWLPAGWKAERDGSIRPENTSRKGCEFVSPILKGIDGVRQIENAIDWAAECGMSDRLYFKVGDHHKPLEYESGTFDGCFSFQAVWPFFKKEELDHYFYELKQIIIEPIK